MAGLSSGSIKLIAALFAGTSVAAVGGSMIIKDDAGQPIIQSLLSSSKTPEEKPAIAPKTEEQEQVAALPQADNASEPALEEPADKKPELPGFDILRVERDGSVVIAGKAPAYSDVEIIENDEAIASGKAGPGGDFAIVFDTPLAPGPHELIIRATPLNEKGEAGEPVLSAEAGIVTIPQKEDAEGEVLAMVQEPGKATRVLQQPETVQEPEPDVKAEPAAEQEPASEPEAVAEAEETSSQEQEPVETVANAPETKPAPKAEVAVRAVDVEDKKVFIAGTGEPGRQVRIYINDAYQGTVKVNPFGNYLLVLNKSLEQGTYDLRVDMLEPGKGDVASRVAVVIDHESDAPAPEPVEVAEVKPAPVLQEEPETIEVTKAEPETAPVKMQAEIVKPAQETVASEPKPAETQATVVEETASAVVKMEPEAEEASPKVVEAETTEPQTQETPTVIKTGRSVIIRPGDSLWRISRRMLGQGRKYTTIFSANANKIKDPNKIYPGQVFDVPDEEETQQADNQG